MWVLCVPKNKASLAALNAVMSDKKAAISIVLNVFTVSDFKLVFRNGFQDSVLRDGSRSGVLLRIQMRFSVFNHRLTVSNGFPHKFWIFYICIIGRYLFVC